MVQMMALGVRNEPIDALGSFQKGQQSQMAANRFNRQEAEAALQTIGSMAMGVMGGSLDGKPNPERWEQALNLLESKGMDVGQYRGRADLAPIIARGSLSTMQQLQNARSDQEMELAMRRFDETVRQNAISNSMARERLDLEQRKVSMPSAPDLETLYGEDGGQYKAYYDPSNPNADENGYVQVGGSKPPPGTQVRMNPDGTFEFQQGSGLKPLTEGQSKDTVFATRAEGALPTIDQYGDELTSAPQNVAERFPGGNYVLSEEYQKASQAGKEFLQAILRKDTGAAITKEETAEYGSVYLPQPGDKEGTLEQKRQSRQRALDAIKAGMPPQAILAQEKALGKASEEAEKPVENRIFFDLESGTWKDSE